MTLQVIRDPKNAPLQPLMNKTIAVIGFGNQGHAQALNMRDSGLNVVVATRPASSSQEKAQQQGFSTLAVDKACAMADLIIMAVPDEAQPELYRQQVEPALRPGAILGFLHGFNIRFNFVKPRSDIGVIMVAPKGPGHTLRQRYLEGTGIPCLFAMHQDSPSRDAQAIGLAWANTIGCARAGIIFTTFKDETDTDLFGEQTVLCGGMTSLILAAFETLVQAGYPPELAYLECCHEVKQIADLVYERGLAGMMKAISNTAEFGAYESGPKIVDEKVRERMREILSRIQSGEFAKALRADHANNFAWFNEQREALKRHPIQPAGHAIRALMPWLNEQNQPPTV